MQSKRRKVGRKKICLKKKFLCDNYIQCEDGKDEERCEGEYLRKRIFPRDYRYVCRSLSLNISRENETGKFFPVRAIRCHHPVTTALSSSLRCTPVIIMVINLMIRCDQVVQCPSGEDEEGCVRFAALFSVEPGFKLASSEEVYCIFLSQKVWHPEPSYGLRLCKT